ncbi:MAG: GldG family protein [Bacteriovoracia bacterium]
MNQPNEKRSAKFAIALWLGASVLGLGLLFGRILLPEATWLMYALGAALVANLYFLIQENKKIFFSKQTAYGLHATVSVLIALGILGVLNLLSYKHPMKLDLTKNSLHTFSDQTKKVVREMKKEVKAVLFSNTIEREKMRPVLQNFADLNSNFKVEYVDIQKEKAAVEIAGITKANTLKISVGDRNLKINEITEEKITNALMKLLREGDRTMCFILGHGEKDAKSNEPIGMGIIKNELEQQAYEVKSVDLPTEMKIPDGCNTIGILGPTRSFLDEEIKVIGDYLNNGGRAIIALDFVFQGPNPHAKLEALIEQWYVKFPNALVIQLPNPQVVAAADISKAHPITKEFETAILMPLPRALVLMPDPPASLNVAYLAKSSPKSWGKTDISEFKTGRITINKGKDLDGPIVLAAVVEGKQKGSTATKNSRLVLFGSSHMVANGGVQAGGNSDFFMNSVSWLMDDENLISIRSKQDDPAKLEIDDQKNIITFWLTVILYPLAIGALGIVVWIRRRRL